jgi:hypothetical protein
LILISTWFAVAVFALIMCRVAARSDDAHDVEVAEWIAANDVAGRGAPSADSSAQQLEFEAERGPYRATG